MVIFRILEDKRLKPIFYFLLVFLLWSRLWALHEKPYHHDEGIYATLSFRYFQNFGYQFSPVTHGPFLYTFQSLLFRIMPINNFSGRLPVALAGIILPFAALGFFRKATSYRAISWIALCVFSPTLCYFSRFLGMDALLITLSVMVATLGLQWWKTERSIYIYSMAFFFAMMLCTKLNWLFYVFSFATFLIVSGDSKAVAKRLKEHWQDTLGFFMIVVYFFGLLYSTLGKHMSGIWDGLFGKMIPYWINQNKLQRI
ncbi:MAG: TIGR03663 family protein, partial [Bdellovibrionales bacterium]|nr:TIGR03663 family protein [Bdellovibrionales bacterium]